MVARTPKHPGTWPFGARPNLLIAALVALTASAGVACSSGSSPTTPSSPAPVPTPAATARYQVTFDALWSNATHPVETPPVPHFSGLIGATHRATTRFWDVGALASDGIRSMAEEGSKTPLDQEMMAAIVAGAAQHLLSGGSIPVSPGSVSLEFEISREQPYVTLVSMVAPSPDWFVGVSALNLFDGDWVAQRVVVLRPYDAGTDSGVTFLSRNRATVPPTGIYAISTTPLAAAGEVAPLGTFTFRRLS